MEMETETFVIFGISAIKHCSVLISNNCTYSQVGDLLPTVPYTLASVEGVAGPVGVGLQQQGVPSGVRFDKRDPPTGVEFRLAWLSGGRGAPPARHRTVTLVTPTKIIAPATNHADKP